MTPADQRDAHVRAILRQLPTSPGVYLMKDEAARVLYVGKADSLRSRVRSYFGSRDPLDARIARMTREVADIDYILTDTVSEAFLLENNLIKEHRPRFNIRLRDDKSYPFVKITLERTSPDRAYPEARQGRKPLLRALRLRNERRRDAEAAPQDLSVPHLQPRDPRWQAGPGAALPPLLHKALPGPCIQAIEKAEYRATIDRIVDFLDGRQEPIAADLRREMLESSAALQYEAAAVSRDKLRAVERTMEQQKMAAYSRVEEDLIGMAREEEEACLQVLQVRNGKMIGREHFIVTGARDVADAEVLGSFLLQYYASTPAIPRHVLVPAVPADADDLAAFLSERGVARHGRRPAPRRKTPSPRARDPERGRGARKGTRRVARRRPKA